MTDLSRKRPGKAGAEKKEEKMNEELKKMKTDAEKRLSDRLEAAGDDDCKKTRIKRQFDTIFFQIEECRTSKKIEKKWDNQTACYYPVDKDWLEE